MNLLRISTAYAAGVIEDAPRLSMLLARVLDFLLMVFGIAAILALGVIGLRYLLAWGDEKRLFGAKNSLVGIVVGIVVVLGALVILRQITTLF